ncbi:Uma2 family endonuclease [Geminicoccaceae bacterium 1502E]|nr:Uma2 family endonuclease [Geminicoccaceae bacterium 1502E]
MATNPRRRMTAEEFLAWVLEQPEGRRHELAAGEVVAMAPERAAHNLAKGAAFAALREALRASGLPCQAFADGMAVRIDDETVYEPDALVRCGERLDPDEVVVTDPLILVEVLSPGTHKLDTGAKLAGYFRLPSLRHYLIVDTSRRLVIHHGREADGAISTRIVAEGTILLEPPGIELAVADIAADG